MVTCLAVTVDLENYGTKDWNPLGEYIKPGLSSSAAVIITYLSVLARVNGITLTQPQIIQYAIRVEREFIGVNVGKLDQSCEVYCKKDELLYLDTSDDTTELIPVSPNMPPFKLAIIYSSVSRKLAGSAYNLRVDECKAAAYALKGYSGMEYAMGLGKEFTVVCAADVLNFAESIEKLSEADCVVLVEKQEESTLADISKELEALKAWNKPVLGAVVVGVDAVM